MNFRIYGGLLAAALSVAAPCTRAEEGGGAPGACRADFDRFCKGVEPGGGRIIRCMKEHHDQLSDGCRKELEAKAGEMKKRAKAGLDKAKEACQADVEKFCKDVEPGEGRIVKCLESHRKELSDACQAVSDKVGRKKAKKDKVRANVGKFEEACGGDVEKLCSDVEAGGGRVMGCLRKNKDKLSDSCKALWKGKGPAGPPPDKAGEPKGAKKAGDSGDQDDDD